MENRKSDRISHRDSSHRGGEPRIVFRENPTPNLNVEPTNPTHTVEECSSESHTIFQFHFDSLLSTVRSELSRCTVVFPLCVLPVRIFFFSKNFIFYFFFFLDKTIFSEPGSQEFFFFNFSFSGGDFFFFKCVFLFVSEVYKN